MHEQKLIRTSTYHSLANEYYDSSAHPTSRDFRESSAQITRYFVNKYMLSLSQITWCYELGAGDSLVAKTLLDLGITGHKVVASDLSIDMLSYSRKYVDSSLTCTLVVADNEKLPYPDGAAAFIVCNLGDPYNTASMWYEVSRTLCKGGLALFTVPSYIWECEFKKRAKNEKRGVALFEKRSGEKVYVRSNIYCPGDQQMMINRAGLNVFEYGYRTSGDLDEIRSWKTKSIDTNLPLVDFYIIEKPKFEDI